MDIWVGEHRPSATTFLTRFCEQIDNDFQIEHQKLRQATAKIEEQNAEIMELRARLQKRELENQTSRPRALASVSDPLPTVSHLANSPAAQEVESKRTRGPEKDSETGPGKTTTASTHDDPPQPVTDWPSAYNGLIERHNALKFHFTQAKAMLSKRTESREQWIRYAECLAKQVEKMGGDALPQPARSAVREKPKAAHDAAGSNCRAGIRLPRTSLCVNFAPDVSNPPADVEAGLSPLFPDEEKEPLPSSDDCVVLLERTVRKRKRPDAATAESVPRRIKREESSSPVMPPAGRNQSPQQESLDLDQVGRRLETPRKRRQGQQLADPSPLTPEPPSEKPRPPRRLAVPAAGKKNPEPGRIEHGAVVFPEPSAPGVASDHRGLHHTAAKRSSALQPISSNVRIRPEGNAPPKTPKPSKSGLRNGVRSLAEDEAPDHGTAGPASAGWSKPRGPNRLRALLDTPCPAFETDLAVADATGPEHPTNANIRGMSRGPGRLRALLEASRSAVEDAPAVADKPRPEYPTDAEEGGIGFPERRDLPFVKKARQAPRYPGIPEARPSPAASRAQGKAAGSATKEPRRDAGPRGAAGRLGNRPLSSLHPDDFRVNPAFNDGHDFAFSEVIRDKGTRAQLPGCVDPTCCGKDFRAMAQAERPSRPLTPAERAEETLLLERYLGDDAHKLTGMAPRERQELWIEAKTRELARRYGRHKHRYARPRSPPGFWRADFPSTQELELERLEAAQRERDVVSERYREAMRPGGRWLFRDE